MSLKDFFNINITLIM